MNTISLITYDQPCKKENHYTNMNMAINSTKENRREYDRNRYHANIEKERERSRLKSSKFRKLNPEKAREMQKKSELKNPNTKKVYDRKYVEKNKSKIRERSKIFYYDKGRGRHLVKTYGIDNIQYSKMLEEQKYRCAICLTDQNDLNKPLFVDHCHKSSKIRGLLCNRCNTGLGMFQDNIQNLQRALGYLLIKKQ